MILSDLASLTEAGLAKARNRFPFFGIMIGKRSASVLVALKLLLQGQQLGKRRIRIRLLRAARRLIGAPGSRLPFVVTAITIALAPRTTITAILARRSIAALRTTIRTPRPLRPIRTPLIAGFAFVRLAFVRSGFDRLTFGRLAVDILARPAIAAAVTRPAVTLLALAIAWRRGIGGDSLTVRTGSGGTLSRRLTFGRRCRPLMTAAASTAPFGIAGAAFALWTAGAPHLDHLRLGGRRSDRGRRSSGFSAGKFNARQQRLGCRRRLRHGV